MDAVTAKGIERFLGEAQQRLRESNVNPRAIVDFTAYFENAAQEAAEFAERTREASPIAFDEYLDEVLMRALDYLREEDKWTVSEALASLRMEQRRAHEGIEKESTKVIKLFPKLR